MTRRGVAMSAVIVALAAFGAHAAGPEWPSDAAGLPELGAGASGALERNDRRTADGAFADLYRLKGVAGRTVYVRVDAWDFKDPRVALYDAAAGREMEISGAYGKGSANVTVTLPTSGDYVLRIASKSKKLGRYAITVLEVGGAPAAG